MQTISISGETSLTLEARLTELLDRHLARSAQDPFTNPFLLFALDLDRELQSGELTIDQLERLIAEQTLKAFVNRAERLGAYLGDCDAEALSSSLSRMFDDLARAADFDSFAAKMATTPFGVVLTGHPTFSMRQDLSDILVELATGRDSVGRALDEPARAERLAAARAAQGPPTELSLTTEHQWSTRALDNAHRAMEIIYRCVYAVARDRWPERWTELRPSLLTLATWVGFDQDGRTDISWQISFEKRLELKKLALDRRAGVVRSLLRGAEGDWKASLRQLFELLNLASTTVDLQLACLRTAQGDKAATPVFAKAMVEGKAAAMVDCGLLLETIDAASSHAPDDATKISLLTLRASIATQGLSLARIHVRLNSGQLHNAIRRQLGLETEPTDPANRHTYFAALERLIEEVEPVQINFGDLLDEPASARRLMMTLAQMRKFVDASTPVRFLIAETETGFTLLTALYYARLFGVEDAVEISPLFETEEALERGEKVIEEALRSPHYVSYLKRQGRIAIEFGFSDSGRFIGQMAATFRIERLRLRLAVLLKARDLGDLEVIFFNTHGESVGRGGHPSSLGDRFRYAAPPVSRREFFDRGMRVREEDAFQGGEGYLPLMTPSAALATLTSALQSVLCDDLEAIDDPIYQHPDFASEFFATVQEAFADLAQDRDYATLIGLFGTHLLPKTGSRPVQRQTGDGGRPRNLATVSELRAIPNNGVLHQLGYLANTLYGVGKAAHKDPLAVAQMRVGSPRFRRALELVQSAWEVSDLRVLRAYAAAVDPMIWLERAKVATSADWAVASSEVAERTGLGESIAHVTQRLQREDLDLNVIFKSFRSERRDRLLLLHGLRIAIIQRMGALAVQFPEFAASGDLSRAVLQERLLRLDVPDVLKSLRDIFPIRAEKVAIVDFAEPSNYARAVQHAYRREHEQVFEPIRRLFELALSISTAVTHEIGAVG